MAELLTAAQMRVIEQAAIASGEVTGLELMERAGRGVVEAIFEEWPEMAEERAPAPAHPGYLRQEEGVRRAVVLCGPGNNGGDGFVVARLLHERGWTVEVFLYGDPEKLPPDARVNYERWREIGEVCPLSPNLEPSMLKPCLIVDALFGTGLTRPIDGIGLCLLDLDDCVGQGHGFSFETRPKSVPFVVSVDLPSGVCSDSGKILSGKEFIGLPEKLEAAAARADLCVTFHRAKLGHFLEDGPYLCGKVVVKDIGL
ncbi:NAD(P)H-hydrate epimerase [Ruegeria marisflavi]